MTHAQVTALLGEPRQTRGASSENRTWDYAFYQGGRRRNLHVSFYDGKVRGFYQN